jgi:hypothetical protein
MTLLTPTLTSHHLLPISHPIGCDEFYIPPDGGLDLRGFSAAATFVRGVFDKVWKTIYYSKTETIEVT